MLETPELYLLQFMKHGLLYLFLLVISLCGCNTKSASPILDTDPAFYHWKTEFAPTPSEWNILRHHKVKELYIRFFDVAWDPNFKKPLPIAQLRVGDRTIFSKETIGVIPTVFITNECIKNIQPEQCRPLAENIYKLITGIAAVNALDPIREIQIDCDWTAASRDKYFSLLQHLQQIDTLHAYSATIRLFQVKYKKDAGVPPVKKGLLMCYNMGNLKSIETRNSILDPGELKKYTGNLQDYPLPLDLALPLFSWYVLFRENKYEGLIQGMNGEVLKTFAKPLGENRFEIMKDIELNGYRFKKADLLRYESSSYENIMKAASILKQKINNKHLRLSLYHLDSIILSKYSTHEIEAIFSSFR